MQSCASPQKLTRRPLFSSAVATPAAALVSQAGEAVKLTVHGQGEGRGKPLLPVTVPTACTRFQARGLSDSVHGEPPRNQAETRLVTPRAGIDGRQSPRGMPK